MAAVTAAVVAGAATAYGANRQAAAGRDAARATQRGADAATAEQRRQYDLTRADNAPWLQAGTDALARQQAFLNGDTSGFDKSADYQWALSEGFKGLDRGAAASGNLLSGGTDADRIALGQGLATQYAGNYWNKLAGLSGSGQQAGQYLGQAGQNSANQISGNYRDAAAGRASAYQQSGQAWANAGNQLAGIGSWYASQRKPKSYGPGVG